VFPVRYGLRRTLRSDSSRRGGSFFVEQPVSSYLSFRGYAPLFAAYRAVRLHSQLQFEFVHVYVYNVEPSDYAFSSPPTLRLCS
jgi:hypothetical protein